MQHNWIVKIKRNSIVLQFLFLSTHIFLNIKILFTKHFCCTESKISIFYSVSLSAIMAYSRKKRKIIDTRKDDMDLEVKSVVISLIVFLCDF